MVSTSHLLGIGKRVVSDFSNKNVTFMAAGIAYNAFVSLAPLLLLFLFVTSIVGGGLENRLLTAARNSLPRPIADVVAQVFATDSTATSLSIVGLVVLLWGTLKLFRGLDTAFSEIYETEGKNSFVDGLVDGVVVLVSIVISIVATIAVSAAFATFSDRIPFLGYVTPLVLVAGLIVAFFPMYYRFPDTNLGWRSVLPGTVVAALGWAILQALFQVYLLFKGGGSEDFFGGVLVIVTWLYFSGLVLLLGAVLNAVVGGHSSGAPGGIGRGAARDRNETESRRSLSREELAGYLRDVRADLTGHREEVEPSPGSTRTHRRVADNEEVLELDGTLQKIRPISLPDGEVEVIERSRPDGDRLEKTITLRWHVPGQEQ